MKWKAYFAGVFSVFLFLVVAGAAYFIGRNQINFSNTPAPTFTPTLEEEPVVGGAVPTTSENKNTKIVSAGGVVSFPAYEVLISEGWQEKIQHDDLTQIDILTLTNEGYEIRIMQGATGGALCLYPGDTPFEGPSAEYPAFWEITASDILLRRSGEEGGEAFTLCEKKDDNTYFQPTTFGHISYKLPAGYDKNILSEMDEMVSTLKKKS